MTPDMNCRQTIKSRRGIYWITYLPKVWLVLCIAGLHGVSAADQTHAQDIDFYAGVKLGLLYSETYSEDFTDSADLAADPSAGSNAAIGVLVGYQPVGADFAFEAEAYTAVAIENGWSGDVLGVYGVYRPRWGVLKFKVGAVRSRVTIDGGQTETNEELALGIGLFKIAENRLYELEMTGSDSVLLLGMNAQLF